MRKLYTGSLWRFLLLAMIVILSPECFGQQYARAGTTSDYQASLRADASLAKRSKVDEKSNTNQNSGEGTVPLKQALELVRDAYNVKFAYREGLLRGLRVPSALLSGEAKSVEIILQRLLTGSSLSFKRINKKQFSIFEDSNGTAKLAGSSMEIAKQEVTGTDGERSPVVFDVTGVVTSEDDGSPIPGVNVLLKGTTIGTTTDAEGKFAINLPQGGGVLVFSFIGFATKEVPISTETIVNVSMAQEAQSLNEVVVTAFGIAKEKKGLVYSVTEVKGSEFTQARETNIANALTGKIAGVNATGMATGPGGSSRIVIRGNGSLGGSNQPLYVINGMPMDNSVPGGATESTGNGNNVDRGDGIGGINPDDIESLSVLKGGPAAALYGARASNGVILITTKKGRAQKGIGVEINSNFTVEDIALIPEWQYEYGQGVDGVKPTTQTQAKSSGRLSYGAKMDGEPYVQFDGQTRAYSPQKDNLKNFYRTGTTFVNSVAFTGGNESVNFRFGLNSTKANSIVPNSSFDRKIGNLNLNAKLGSRLSFETVVQYNLEEGINRPKVGYADMNPHWATYLVANTVDIRSLAPGYDPVTQKEVEWNPVPAAPNPYFVINKFSNDDTKNRFLGQANIRLDLTDKMFLKGSISRDYYSFKSQFVQPTGNAYMPLGTYEERDVTSSETNGMLTLNYSTELFNALNLTALVGGNMQRNVYDQIAINGSEFTIPYFYSYTNLATMTTTPTYYKTAINSVFGSLDLSYKGMIYLTMSGRQDWFSVLNPSSNSIFYPAIGGTFIMSEAIQFPQAVSFAKLRASWAQVGGANVGAYQTYQT
jgi:TonB-linked SusC/RagA family outer membrane protein